VVKKEALASVFLFIGGGEKEGVAGFRCPGSLTGGPHLPFGRVARA
jgi:hypothetical protein